MYIFFDLLTLPKFEILGVLLRVLFFKKKKNFKVEQNFIKIDREQG